MSSKPGTARDFNLTHDSRHLHLSVYGNNVAHPPSVNTYEPLAQPFCLTPMP